MQTTAHAPQHDTSLATSVAALWSPAFRGVDRATFAPSGVRWVDLPDHMRRTHRHRLRDYSLRSSAWMALGEALGPAARARYGGTQPERNYLPVDLFTVIDTAGKHSMLVIDSTAMESAAVSVLSGLSNSLEGPASDRLEVCVGFAAAPNGSPSRPAGPSRARSGTVPWVAFDDKQEEKLSLDADGVTLAGTTRFVLAQLYSSNAPTDQGLTGIDAAKPYQASGHRPAGGIAFVESDASHATPMSSVSIWKLLWPAAAPRTWNLPRSADRSGMVVRLPLPVTPSPLLQYRLHVHSQECDTLASSHKPSALDDIPGPLWWPLAYYTSTAGRKRCFACESMFLPAVGIPPPRRIGRVLEKSAFDQSLHAPVGYSTEHRLSTHALRPHVQFDSSTNLTDL